MSDTFQKSRGHIKHIQGNDQDGSDSTSSFFRGTAGGSESKEPEEEKVRRERW